MHYLIAFRNRLFAGHVFNQNIFSDNGTVDTGHEKNL